MKTRALRKSERELWCQQRLHYWCPKIGSCPIVEWAIDLEFRKLPWKVPYSLARFQFGTGPMQVFEMEEAIVAEEEDQP